MNRAQDDKALKTKHSIIRYISAIDEPELLETIYRHVYRIFLKAPVSKNIGYFNATLKFMPDVPAQFLPSVYSMIRKLANNEGRSIT